MGVMWPHVLKLYITTAALHHLADDNRPSSNDHDGFDIGPFLDIVHRGLPG